MTRPTRTAAVDQFERALVTLAVQGQRPRCGDPEAHHYWTSEHQAERVIAADWCTGCSVLDLCRTAAYERGEQFGVWGGRDFTRRTPGAGA
jgi:hypothetical protein